MIIVTTETYSNLFRFVAFIRISLCLEEEEEELDQHSS